MKLSLIFLATLALGQTAPQKPDPPKEPTVQELQAKIDQQKQENERLLKLLNAYLQKFRACDQELTQWQVLGPPQAADKKP